jgi:PRC-barrel domain
METIAQWVAPIATMIAAMMTAANLGARITGWGFVVFTVGSIGWVILGLASGQQSLIYANGFLVLVNLVGIWRWLGRQVKYEDGGAQAAEKSADHAAPTLRPAGSLGGAKVTDARGEAVGEAVETMIECDSGRVNYVVISTGGMGGVGETLRAIPFARLRFEGDGLTTDMTRAEIEALPERTRDDWPAALAA